jgi:hypothetical protein
MRLASPLLGLAALDYRWLLDRGYAETSSLKLVGDRHRLSRDERMILFRGVASGDDSAGRLAVLFSDGQGASGDAVGGRAVFVDGYNQALTVMHYLAGRPLFLGSDGLTRDAGGSYGRIADAALFERAAGILVDRLTRPLPGRIALFLDSPLPGSAGHAELFRRLFAERGVEAEVSLEKSADFPLKAVARATAKAASGPTAPVELECRTLIATGDCAIVDALRQTAGEGPCRARIYDAARWAIELAFGAADILDLGLLLREAGKGPIEAL